MRPHSSLKAQTPDQVYFNRLPAFLAARTQEQNFHLRLDEICSNNRDQLSGLVPLKVHVIVANPSL